MTRPQFFEPSGGLHPEIVYDAMLLVAKASTLPPLAEVERWTPMELLVAFDWAMRVHLNASDNQVQARPRPRFTQFRE